MELAKLVKMKCVEMGTTPRQLEHDLGFSNGYLSSLKFPMKNFQRAVTLSERLNIPLSDLVDGIPESKPDEPPPETTDITTDFADLSDPETSDDIRMLLSLNAVGRAELRGEMRQMLRLKKYNDLLS